MAGTHELPGAVGPSAGRLSGFSYGLLRSFEYMHLTGGLTARRVAGGCGVGPLGRSDGAPHAITVPEQQRRSFGHRWDNIAIADFRLALRFLVSEMASARDHLARIVGLHLGAAASKNSLVWLFERLNAASRRHLLSEPMVAVLQAGWTENRPDRWLHELSEYCSAFQHRAPLVGRGIDGAPTIKVRPTLWGDIPRPQIRLPAAEADPQVDALGRFVELHRRMTLMAADLADLARYPTTRLVITSADLAAPERE